MEALKDDSVRDATENKDLKPQIKEFLDVIAECIMVVIIRERPTQVLKDMVRCERVEHLIAKQ